VRVLADGQTDTLTHRLTDTQTHTHTDTHRFYNLSHAITMGQIITTTIEIETEK